MDNMLRKLFVTALATASLMTGPALAFPENASQTCRFENHDTDETSSCVIKGTPACKQREPGGNFKDCAEWRSFTIVWEDGTVRTFVRMDEDVYGKNVWKDDHPEWQRSWRFEGKNLESYNGLPTGTLYRIDERSRIILQPN